jgi:phenylalanyl-tRNA synthetase beta chain
VAVANPIRADESVLRTALVPGLVGTAAANAARGRADLALFELGTVFSAPEPGAVLPTERLHVAALLTGRVRRRPLEPDRPVDVADALDLVRAVAAALALDGWDVEPAGVAGYHPSRTVQLVAAGGVLGHAGELAATATASVELPGPVVAMELDVTALADAPRRDRAFQELSPFPPSTIDLDFVVDEAVPAAALLATLRRAGAGALEDVRVFDEYRGDQLGRGRKSLAFALVFRADHTLTQQEVAALRDRCIEAVTTAHHAALRH